MEKKIVYCIRNLNMGGGIQKVTIIKANALASRGYDVTIAVTQDYNNSFFVEPIMPNVKILNLGINYYYGHKNIFKNIRKIFQHKRTIKKIIKEQSVDIVISLGYWERFFLPFIKTGKTKKIREIHYVSNYKFFNSNNKIKCFFKKAMCFFEYKVCGPLWDRTILLTNFDYENCWIGYKKNTLVITNPLTIEPIESSLSNKVIISIGRLAPQKNHQLLIKSFAYVHKKHPEWQLRILGDGAQKQSLKRLIDDLGLSECVTLVGNTNNVPQELSNSSLFVLCSIYEGLCLSVIEAISCGLPVVATNSPGIYEIIDGYNCGLLTTFDETEISDKICMLIEDNGLMQKLKSNALKRAQDYSKDEIINIWENLFNNL